MNRLFLAFAIILFASCRSNNRNNTDRIGAYAFKTEKGWGYDITVNGKLFIKQQFIPVIQGNHPFESKEDAARVGEFVADRIKKNERAALQMEDLQQLGILK